MASWMLVLAACGGPAVDAARAPAAVDGDGAERSNARRAPGVILDLEPAVPEAGARVPARGVVAMEAPLGDDDVRVTVAAFFAAIEREDEPALARLATSDAVALAAGGERRGSLADLWRGRFRAYDYARLAGADVARVERLERFELVDLARPGAPSRPEGFAERDVLVRVPVDVARLGGEPLLGEVVWLVLRRGAQGEPPRIAAMGDEGR